jgi:hypothetical protein
MQMCVDNGMFTVSFLKEGLGKVSFPSPTFCIRAKLILLVPRMAGRSAQLLLGSLPRL